MQQRYSQRNRKTLRGASLIELLVAIFVFILVIVGASAILISSLNNQRAIKKLQGDYDKSSTVVNEMVKVISTGELPIDTVQESGTSSVMLYSASQNACIQYSFSGQYILRTARLMGEDSSDLCDAAGTYLSSEVPQVLVDVTVNGYFRVDPELEGDHAANVTVFMEVVPGVSGAGDSMYLQETAALRKSIVDF